LSTLKLLTSEFKRNKLFPNEEDLGPCLEYEANLEELKCPRTSANDLVSLPVLIRHNYLEFQQTSSSTSVTIVTEAPSKVCGEQAQHEAILAIIKSPERMSSAASEKDLS